MLSEASNNDPAPTDNRVQSLKSTTRRSSDHDNRLQQSPQSLKTQRPSLVRQPQSSSSVSIPTVYYRVLKSTTRRSSPDHDNRLQHLQVRIPEELNDPASTDNRSSSSSTSTPTIRPTLDHHGQPRRNRLRSFRRTASRASHASRSRRSSLPIIGFR
jgi:hypothetical protein